MSVADILRGVGKGLATGARVAGAAAAPVLARTAEVVSGQAPELDAEKRQHQQQLEDAEINAKANELEAQLEMGRKYGTLDPAAQQQYVDAIANLYSHPRHAPLLMDRLRRAIHPNGTYAQDPTRPLPIATPAGGTAAADIRMQEGVEARTLADALTLADRRAQDTAENRARKPLKSTISGNVFLGVSDPNTGQNWGIQDLQPGGSAPDEAKAMYREYQQGRKEQQDEKDKQWEREQKEIEKRQEVTNANMLNRMQLQFQNMLSMGNFRAANNVVQGLEKNYATSQTLESRMKQLEPKALQGDQQAMLAILANHIAMTTHQPGASMRPTQALFDEAASAQPWLQKISKRVGSDGVISGVVLSPQQIRQMVDLAPIMVNADLAALTQARQLMGDQLNPSPAGTTGAKRVGRLLPKIEGKAAARPSSNDTTGKQFDWNSLPEVNP